MTLYHANFVSAIGFHGNVMVTLAMVPDRFERRATVHFAAFEQRKQVRNDIVTQRHLFFSFAHFSAAFFFFFETSGICRAVVNREIR